MSDRNEERDYENEVFYEAWRRGMNPDRAVECAIDCYWSGRTPMECVDGYERRIRHAQQQREADEYFDECHDRQEQA